VLTQRRLRNRAAAAASRQLRRRPTGRARHVDQALVAASDLPLVRWANHELAALGDQLKPDRVSANPIAVELSATHGLELLWDEPQPSAPAPWEAFDGGWAWRLCYDPDLPIPANPEPAVIPGLVTVGQRDTNTLAIDLEAFGSLAITGDSEQSEDLLRALLIELAHDDDLANTYLHLIDLDLAGLEHSDRIQHRSAADGLDVLRSVTADHDQLLGRHRLHSTFQLRLAGAAIGRELTVVAARADTLHDPGELVPAARLHRGVALILLGDASGVGATIDVTPDGRDMLQPLGLMFQAHRLPATTAHAVGDLLDQAAHVDESTNDAEPPGRLDARPLATVIATAAAADEIEVVAVLDEGDRRHTDPPDPELLVRVLGAPVIDGHSGLGRIELNLVTYLACNGGQATESQVIDAVWNGRAIERATLWNRISKARATLGRVIPARDQGSNSVRLAPGVMTDAQLLRAAHDRAIEFSAAQAVDQLSAALESIRGVPFDAVGYDWAHEQQHYADVCELVERTALTVVDLALDLDDINAARYAVSQGLKALRVNEPLYRARMRIEAHCGNHTGVRAAYDELTALLDELADGTDSYTPAPATVALRDELLQAGRRSA
jgi:DNA-binding SARP family transcriptional activator